MNEFTFGEPLADFESDFGVDTSPLATGGSGGCGGCGGSGGCGGGGGCNGGSGGCRNVSNSEDD
jgi:hypothetical protein